MKIKGLILLSFLFYPALIACQENKNEPDAISKYYIPENYIENTHDPEFIYKKSIIDAFPLIKDNLMLTEGEIKLIGMWNALSIVPEAIAGNIYTPVIFPNYLILLGSAEKGYKIKVDNKDIYLKYFYGLWNIEKESVYVTIYGCIFSISKREKEKNYKEIMYYWINKLKNRIRFKLTDLERIDKKGFTLRPFYNFNLNQELIDFMKIINENLQALKGIYSIREFCRRSIIDSSINYLEFTYLEEMIKNKISGEMIINNPKKYGKYIGVDGYIGLESAELKGEPQ